MNHIRLLAVVSLMSAIVAGCGGGRQSVASKSAEAYREAIAKGIPVKAGGHGGHTNEAAEENSGMAGMDHGSMPGMEHGTAAAAGHDMSKMPGMEHGSMAGMDHSKMQSGSMAGMDHSTMQSGSMAGMDHSKMQSGSMAGMDHSKMQSGSMAGMGNMAGMHHSTTPAAAVDLGTPATSASIAKLNPSGTLQQDEFDKPAPGGHR